MKGRVYSETTISDPAPYQVAIVDLEDGGRRTVRIEGPPVTIGDEVTVEDQVGYSGSPPNHFS